MVAELIRSVRSADATGALNHFLSFALFVLAAVVIAMSTPLWSFDSIVIMSYLATDCVLSNLLAKARPLGVQFLGFGRRGVSTPLLSAFLRWEPNHRTAGRKRTRLSSRLCNRTCFSAEWCGAFLSRILKKEEPRNAGLA